VARANRHHILGQVWHITHRCHKREFLLKFSKDRRRWQQWLFEAKKRKGAFGDDRYHATAIETGEHLLRCIAYIDLNMVRNGVVTHPSLWEHGGYNEIQDPRERYSILDRDKLVALSGCSSDE